MDDVDIHAIIMIGLLLIAGGFVWANRKNRVSILRGFLAFLLVFVVVSGWGPAYAFGPKHVAIMQVLIPAVIASVVAAFIAKLWARWLMNAVCVFVAVILATHFINVAVNPKRCAYTGHTTQHVSGSCDKPAVAHSVWHSWFTGLYALKPL